MREHNYGLQYWLYSVVLDLYFLHRVALKSKTAATFY
jgi:hypothetical protein